MKVDGQVLVEAEGVGDGWKVRRHVGIHQGRHRGSSRWGPEKR